MRQDGKKLKKWSTVSQKIYHIYANNCQKNDRQVLIFLVKINQDIFNLIFIGGRGGGCTPNTNSRIEKIYEFSSHGIWFYTFPNRITSLSCSKKVLGATVGYCRLLWVTVGRTVGYCGLLWVGLWAVLRVAL